MDTYIYCWHVLWMHVDVNHSYKSLLSSKSLVHILTISEWSMGVPWRYELVPPSDLRSKTSSIVHLGTWSISCKVPALDTIHWQACEAHTNHKQVLHLKVADSTRLLFMLSLIQNELLTPDGRPCHRCAHHAFSVPRKEVFGKHLVGQDPSDSKFCNINLYNISIYS